MKKYIIVLVLISLCNSGYAATFCVDDTSSFKAALSTASQNGEDDHIKLKSGDYLLGGSIASFTLSEDHDLTLSGGWNDLNNIPCLSQSNNPYNTVLDANDESGVLIISDGSQSINTDANITISRLTISNGVNSSTVSNTIAGGLTIWFPDINYTGEVMIDRVFFIGNNAVQTSALKVHHSELLTIRNSIFTFNQTSNGVGAVNINLQQPNDSFYFINNTVMFNSHEVAQPTDLTTSGLFVTNAEQGYVANNLLWSNGGQDLSLFLNGTIHYLFNNNYESMGGVLPDFMGDNISSAPILAPQLINFTPQPGSPLIDAGKVEPLEIVPDFELGWGYGNQDFDGFGRVINNRVDIGAIEAPGEIPIFENGFE